MTVSILGQQQAGPQSWQVQWASDIADALFYIYQNGTLAQTTRATSGVFHVTAGSQLWLEILDDPDAKPTEVYPGVVVLGWYQTPDTAFYRIDEWTGTGWMALQTLPDAGAWWVRWVSPFLPDGEAYRFRVVPIGNNGNAGAPQEFSGVMVRHPDSPAPTFAINPDRTVTIA